MSSQAAMRPTFIQPDEYGQVLDVVGTKERVLLLVIPAYNEEENVPQLIEQLEDYRGLLAARGAASSSSTTARRTGRRRS